MEIVWQGHSCFRITERGLATVVCDPYDSEAVGFEPLRVRGDVVTVSNPTPGHNFSSAVKGSSFVVTSPGEYEIGGAFITGIQTTHPNKKGESKPRNCLFVIDYTGITVVHLGMMDRVPTQTEVENLGTVNILLLPVGGDGALSASKATEVVSLLEPNVVIPMMYNIKGSTAKLDPLSKFMKEMGVSSSETQLSFKVSKAGDLPDETQIVVLDRTQSSPA